MRRRHATALVVVLAYLSLAASCNPPAQLTTKGKVIWKATQIEQRVAELQNSVIQANVTGACPDNVAIVVVSFTVSGLKTLKALPEGWQQTLVVGWAEMKKKLPPAWQANPAVAAAFGAVDIILAEGVL